MAVTMKQMSLLVSVFGIVSFLLGIITQQELIQPAAGTPVPGKDVMICKYPKDLSVALGYVSVLFLIASTVCGYLSLFYPYKGKSVPHKKLFSTTNFFVFFNIAQAVAGLAFAFLLWATITEHFHLTKNVHRNLETTCPTAKTGLLGGVAFLSLDASLLWLVTLMLARNVREDYFEEIDGEYSEHSKHDA